MFDRTYTGSISLFKAEKTHMARIHRITPQGAKPGDRIVVDFYRQAELKHGTAILDGEIARRFRARVEAEGHALDNLPWKLNYFMELTGRWGRMGHRNIVFVPSALGELRIEEADPKTCTPNVEGKFLCENCEQHFHEVDIEIAPDPFASDIYGDETPCVLCRDCREEKACDI